MITTKKRNSPLEIIMAGFNFYFKKSFLGYFDISIKIKNSTTIHVVEFGLV